MKTETENPKLRGEDKHIVALRNFNYQGRKVSIGESIRIDDDETIKDILGRRWGRLVGGAFTVEPMADGFPRVIFWNRRYLEGERFRKVRFLKDVGFFPAGFRCRLRMSDISDFTIVYEDTPPEDTTNKTRAIPFHPVLMICEPRPRPALEPEELADRQLAVAEGMARDAASWMHPKN